MSRKKEYLAVAIIHLLFAKYNDIFLAKIPDISLMEIDYFTYLAILGWFLYGGGLCMVLIWKEVKIKGIIKSLMKAMVTGTVVVLARIITDYFIDHFIKSGGKWVNLMVVFGILNIIFGSFLIVILFLVYVKERKGWNKHSVMPSIFIFAEIAVYICGLTRLFYEEKCKIELMGTGEKILYQIDYYYALAIVAFNWLTYPFFIISLWWFIRTLCVGESIDLT